MAAPGQAATTHPHHSGTYDSLYAQNREKVWKQVRRFK